jgi:uncharacterized protein
MIEFRPNLTGEVGASSSRHLCRVLALSGGGYRGLFAAHTLTNLEDLARRPVVQIFDLIVGTSTGALLGAALAAGIPAAKIEQAYLKWGPLIFSDKRGKLLRSMRRLFHSAPYGSEALFAAIRDLLGAKVAGTPLKDLNIPFVATVVSHTREQVRWFGGGRFANGSEKITIEEAIVASAAAPTYFPSRQYQGENLVDGGLAANAPELIAITIAKNKLGTGIDDMRVLAIGTASPSG